MTEDLPVYEECDHCGWMNLADDHFCGYCAEEWCPEPDNCTQCGVFSPGYLEDFEVY